MAERTSYLAGTPSWVDIGVPDTAAAAEFYGGLFGWTLQDMGPDAGGYGMFQLRGLDVAGVGPQQMPDAPPFWTVYMSVDDVAATTEKVIAGGGTVVVPPMQVFEAGHMAVYQDPAGTFFSAWQPLEHIGCRVVNEAGAFVWNELAAVDVEASRSFYAEVFGWGSESPEGHDGGAFTVDGQVVCGSHTANPGEFPAWSVWFSVEDTDASAAKVTELGGSILMPPSDMDFGRGAVVADPAGGVFGIAAVNVDELPAD